MTLIMTLVFVGNEWYLRLLLHILAIWALLCPTITCYASFWFVLAGLTFVVETLLNWEWSDNHEYLYTYWYVVLGCACLSQAPDFVLRKSARLVIGLAFLFAVLRKLLSGEYLSGDTFRFLLVTDPRFFEVFRLVTGYSEQGEVFASMRRLEPLVLLPDNSVLVLVANVLTWWALAIELAIAASFLIPGGRITEGVRHALLMLFIVTTYPMAPVLGFAWILIIMGLSQLSADAQKMRLGYVFLFGAIYIWRADHLKLFLVESIS